MKTLKTHTCEANIETKLVDALDGKLFAVIVRDLDVNELVTRVNCETRDLAEKYFNKYAFGAEAQASDGDNLTMCEGCEEKPAVDTAYFDGEQVAVCRTCAQAENEK